MEFNEVRIGMEIKCLITFNNNGDLVTEVRNFKVRFVVPGREINLVDNEPRDTAITVHRLGYWRLSHFNSALHNLNVRTDEWPVWMRPVGEQHTTPELN